MEISEFQSWLKSPRRRPLIIGVLNLTPDSFSDGGKFSQAEAALEHVREMIADGADWIDIGGESTRPGSLPISADEQIRRIVPALKLIRAEFNIPISIDTTQSAVASAALDCGANIVNDISAGRDDPAMFGLIASRGVPVILMHMQGSPATMQDHPVYDDVTADVSRFLQERASAAESAGIARHQILLDPGIGFGKADSHNLQLLKDTSKLASLGYPLVVGPSRKGFIGRITGEIDATRRLAGTLAAVSWCVANQAAAVRVHDVKPMAQAVRMIQAIQKRQWPAAD
jgi:dihydropteroate synthase